MEQRGEGVGTNDGGDPGDTLPECDICSGRGKMQSYLRKENGGEADSCGEPDRAAPYEWNGMCGSEILRGARYDVEVIPEKRGARPEQEQAEH